MSKNQQALLWSLIALALAAFGQELAAGHVPIPATWAWVVPIVLAVINGATPNLRRKP